MTNKMAMDADSRMKKTRGESDDMFRWDSARPAIAGGISMGTVNGLAYSVLSFYSHYRLCNAAADHCSGARWHP